jgi:predicted transcriptional regulator
MERRRRTFPSEMVILMAITVNKDAGKKLLNRPMDVTGEYIGFLYDSLVKRGYLRENSSRGYQLTTKGRETLFEFLHENKTRVKDTIKRLQQLGIDISQEHEIDKLEKEAIGVK